MTDVIVKIELEDPESEARLFEAVDHFATNKGTKALSEHDCDDAPQIMIKSVPDGGFCKKTVIFQDRNDAEEFMFYWRRYQQVA